VSYNGFEVDLFSLGNADSILVGKWSGLSVERVLVDGGNYSDGKKVLEFLATRRIGYLDHIVCSHPHDDHAGGLFDVVSSPSLDFGAFWIHLPWNHIDFTCLQGALREGESTAKRVVQTVRKSLKATSDLVEAVRRRGKPIFEPFKARRIGPLFVCGPEHTFYEGLLSEFADFEKLKEYEDSLEAYERRIFAEDILEGLALSGQQYESDVGLGEAPTEPENESSTVLWTSEGNNQFLLTADAGVNALTRVTSDYNLQGLYWMQIPHHGSRRNITPNLIEELRPKIACVSADGSKKHPRRAIVNAFNAVGTRVLSTHYPAPSGAHLWFSSGIVPPRPNYVPWPALYDLD
jgi:beta-lactamase superfamily II metal-dependent hydrolase